MTRIVRAAGLPVAPRQPGAALAGLGFPPIVGLPRTALGQDAPSGQLPDAHTAVADGFDLPASTVLGWQPAPARGHWAVPHGSGPGLPLAVDDAPVALAGSADVVAQGERPVVAPETPPSTGTPVLPQPAAAWPAAPVLPMATNPPALVARPPNAGAPAGVLPAPPAAALPDPLQQPTLAPPPDGTAFAPVVPVSPQALLEMPLSVPTLTPPVPDRRLPPSAVVPGKHTGVAQTWPVAPMPTAAGLSSPLVAWMPQLAQGDGQVPAPASTRTAAAPPALPLATWLSADHTFVRTPDGQRVRVHDLTAWAHGWLDQGPGPEAAAQATEVERTTRAPVITQVAPLPASLRPADVLGEGLAAGVAGSVRAAGEIAAAPTRSGRPGTRTSAADRDPAAPFQPPDGAAPLPRQVLLAMPESGASTAFIRDYQSTAPALERLVEQLRRFSVSEGRPLLRIVINGRPYQAQDQTRGDEHAG